LTFAPASLEGALHAIQRNNPVFRVFPIVKPTLRILALLIVGCGDGSEIDEIYPVRGQISFDGEPLVEESTTVLFVPDADRGNESSFDAVGTVDRDGAYTVRTKGMNGACPGWYKVVVTALADTPQHPTGPADSKRHAVARSLLPARYGQAQTTPLAVEVVDEPDDGAYDLELTSQ
jgi:hypothetical protein